jgi:hypothetical protein
MATQGIWEAYITKAKKRIPNDKAIEVPILTLSYRTEIYGGDIHAWPHLGYFTFKTRRDDSPEKLNSSDLIKVIKYNGWKEPTQIKKLEKDIQTSSKLFEQGELNKFQAKCKNLGKCWKKYPNFSLNNAKVSSLVAETALFLHNNP